MKSKLYSTHASAYDKAIRDNIYNAHFERPTLLSMLGDIAGKEVLDLGCGPGVYAEHLLAQGAKRITCVDFSEEMIALVQQKLGEQVTAYSQDLTLGLPREPDNSIDVMICPLVLHYMKDIQRFFKDVQRVLKPGGYLVLSTHHPFADFRESESESYFEQELLQDIWDTIGQPVEVAFYRRPLSSITDAITDNGLAITQINEGKVSEKLQTLSEEHYDYLSRKPNFIFIKCQKLT